MGKKKKQNSEIKKIMKRIEKEEDIDKLLCEFYKEKSALDTFAIFYNVVVVISVSTILHGILDLYFSVGKNGEIDISVVNFFSLYVNIIIAIFAFFLVSSIRKRRESNYLLEHCLKKKDLI